MTAPRVRVAPMAPERALALLSAAGVPPAPAAPEGAYHRERRFERSPLVLAPRVLTCEVPDCRAEFPYKGPGKPPKRCPECRQAGRTARSRTPKLRRITSPAQLCAILRAEGVGLISYACSHHVYVRGAAEAYVGPTLEDAVSAAVAAHPDLIRGG